MFRDFVAAFGYFSILPIASAAADGPPTGRTLTFLALVGAVLGALAGGGALLVATLADGRFAVAIAVVLSVVLSGAIHLDGYLDSCDALFASVPPARRLEILKDPRHGTFALAGLLCLSVTWITALSLVPPLRLPGLMAWTACIARWAAVSNVYFFPYAPGGASSGAFTARPSGAALAFIGIALCAIGATAFSHVWLGLWPLIAEGIAFVLGSWAARRLGGGLVGDVYGAIICVVEVLSLTAFSLYR